MYTTLVHTEELPEIISWYIQQRYTLHPDKRDIHNWAEITCDPHALVTLVMNFMHKKKLCQHFITMFFSY